MRTLRFQASYTIDIARILCQTEEQFEVQGVLGFCRILELGYAQPKRHVQHYIVYEKLIKFFAAYVKCDVGVYS